MSKKLVSLVLAVLLVLAMAVPAMADGGTTTGSITILNASKGETYTLYKIFDATVDPNNTDAIVYLAPEGFEGNDYFEVDTQGYVTSTGVSVLGTEIEDLTDWPATKVGDEVTAQGSAVTFSGLGYGYYYVRSSLGALVTIDTNNTNIVVYDKNIKTPEWHPEDPENPDDSPVGKTIKSGTVNVEEKDFKVGDTVTFQTKIDTVNFVGEDAKDQITSYLIGDTFPDGLQFVEITGVTVDGTDVEYAATNNGFPIKVMWANTDADIEGNEYYPSLYKHGAVLTVTYTATVLNNAVIAGDGNVNTASFNYKTYNPEDHDGPGEDPYEPDDPEDPEDPDDGDGTTQTDTAVVYTYAIAVKKVDPEGNPLTGATFSIAGLQATGSAGVYTYSGATASSGTDTIMETDANGELVVKGLTAGDYSVTEVVAPSGYNVLTAPVTVKATESTNTTTKTTTYLDEDGNVSETETDVEVTYSNDNLYADSIVVVNKTGTELPSTGGIGTTIFYALGSLLLVGAAVLLITRKRMSVNG